MISFAVSPVIFSCLFNILRKSPSVIIPIKSSFLSTTAVAPSRLEDISTITSFMDEFFGGDVIDRQLVETIRSLRGKARTGLISNAWSGLRDFITKEKIIDVFDTIVISAEVGVVKPSAKIYEVALEQAKVKASEAVFVDDVAVNIEGCEKVGMKGILFKDPQETTNKLNCLLKIK